MKRTIPIILLLWLLSFAIVRAQEGRPPKEKPLTVAFSRPGGFYGQNTVVSLDAGGVPVFYTTDGSKPSERSEKYDGRPLLLSETTVLRAFAKKGELKSRTFTQTYFIGEPATRLPIVSVAISPGILFDPEKGIMRPGPNADASQPNIPGANYWTRKEFGCNVEIFETDKRCVHNSPAGFRIFGGYSRVFQQKSIVLVARKKYGKKFFKHKIFGSDGLKKHKYLVLRNGGSDCEGAHFRDELMSELTKNWDIEKQDYRPALLYLNGKYWGIYHIREKINARFLQDHTDADKDSLDLIEHKQTVREGSFRRYEKMLGFVRNYDLTEPDNYARLKTMMDVENFCDHQIAQIYSDNTDAGGNIRYWRAHHPGSRWRWILFDTDWGFGLHNASAYKHNALDFFTEPNGPDWPNPPWSTFLLRNLLKNNEFQRLFVNRLCDRLNTDFSQKNVLAKIEYFEKILSPEMPRHFDRWNLNEKDWREHLQTLREFAEKRPENLLRFFMEKFGLNEMADLEISTTSGGHVMLNRCVSIDKTFFKGRYFEDYPVHLQAVPEFGFKFAGWEGLDAKGRVVQVKLSTGEATRVRARFEPYHHPLRDEVFFNEVCAFNKLTGDWVEIVNGSKQTVSLDGWILTDKKHNEFTFPNISLDPGKYLVVCQDVEAFQAQFPQIQAVAGGFGFGLDRSVERLALYAADGAGVDTILYRVEPLDEPFTVDLMLQNLDNASNANWSVRKGFGSPGEANPLYLAQVISAKKDLWIRVGLGIALLLVAAVAIWRRGK